MEVELFFVLIQIVVVLSLSPSWRQPETKCQMGVSFFNYKILSFA